MSADDSTLPQPRRYTVGGTEVIILPDGHRTFPLPDGFVTNASRVANRGVLVPLLESIFATREAAHWVERCREANIPASLVRGVLEALRSDEAKPLLARLDDFETVGHPVRIDGQRLPVRGHPPKLGEHTEALKRELTDRRARTAPRSTRTRKR